MRVLCVAEKPSQAKEIANKLSDNTCNSRNGPDRFCRNYDFTLDWRGRRCEFIVTSLVGHVQELDFEAGYRKWSSCPPGALFTLPVIKTVAKDKEKVVQNLQTEARRADVLMIWTDCDREGENIGGEVADLARAVNPRLQVHRARFSVMQARELKQACQNPGLLDQRQVDAVDARSEVDLRIGAALTRYQTLSLQNSFESLKEGVISYGSCQFPTLGFVVDRFLKIRDFTPEEFTRIVMSYTKDGLEVAFNWKRGQLFDPLIGVLLYEKCMENCLARVTAYQNRPTSKWRPLPLTTVELQKNGSRFLHMSSDKVMEAANSLYQKGFISYPRTETDIFDPTFELHPLIQKQQADPQFENYSTRLLAGGFCRPRAGKNNDGSHPPIHPTAAAPGLAGDEKKVYEFVTRRFLASCSNDAKGQQTTVEVDIAGESFTAKGLTVLEKNYLEIYIYDRWTDKPMPPFQLGETFIPTVLEMVDGVTSPPNLLSEAELITIMSRNGIGTDATIYEHIRKVLARNYVYKNSRQLFAPSDLGIGLVEGYDSIGMEKSLSKPFLRREFEHSLKGICEGTKTKAVEIQTALNMYFEMFNFTINNIGTLIQAIAKYLPVISNAAPPNIPTSLQREEPVIKCQACSKMMMLRESNRKFYLGCSNFPSCRGSIWFPSDKFSSVSLEAGHCQRCQAQGAQVRLLKFTILDPQIMFFFDQEHVTCISCDQELRNVAGIRMNVNPTQSTGAPRPLPRTASANRNITLPRTQSTNTNQSGGASIEAFRNMLNGSSDPSLQPPKCRCELFAVKLQKNSPGENHGRFYFKCPSTRSCGFFQWIDEPVSAFPQRSTTSSSNNGGNNSVCYKCNQSGHFANNCPQSQGSSANSNIPPGIICFKCNQPGHFANSCPQSQGSSANSNIPPGTICFKCQQTGHFSNACPQGSGQGGSSASGVTCFKCQQRGHVAPDCPQNGNPSGISRGGRGSRSRGNRETRKPRGSKRGRGS